MKKIIEKVLSLNDVGATGAHQGGILIPKQDALLEFFPKLGESEANPREVIYFADDLDQKWKFSFIHYNNRLRGGTRNEYRLTGMTRFLHEANANAGDSLIFEYEDGEYSVRVKKDIADAIDEDGAITLVLDNNWKIIEY